MSEYMQNPDSKTLSLERFRTEITRIRERRGQKDGNLWLVDADKLTAADEEIWQSMKAVFVNGSAALESGEDTRYVLDDIQEIIARLNSFGSRSAFESWIANRLSIIKVLLTNKTSEELKEAIEMMEKERQAVFGK